MKKKYLLILLFLLVLVYYCHPYRGGINRFEQFFGVKLPNETKMESLWLITGSYWDDPRFKFTLKKQNFQELTDILKRAGYTDWKESGGSFGSFNEDSYPDNPLLMCEKEKGSCLLMFFYRPKTETLNAVTFYH